MILTLKIGKQAFCKTFRLITYITIPSLVTKGSTVQKVSSRQISNDIFNPLCDLHHNTPISSYMTLWIMNWKTRFGYKRSSSLESIIETVIFWLYQYALWLWPWRQQPNFCSWEFGSWYLTIPHLTTADSELQKILSRQTLTAILNLAVTLITATQYFTVQHPLILFFLRDTLVHDDAPPYQV